MGKKSGMGSHQSAKMGKDEWLTPPEVIKSLGKFNLDPCSPIVRPWDTAQKHYSIKDSGLMLPWEGRVWLNPPYGKQTGIWLNKLAMHGTGTALIFARTDTQMFFSEVWNRATSILFIKGRLFFHHVDGSRAKFDSGAPSVLIAYGQDDSNRLRKSNIKGKFIDLVC